MTDGNGQAAGQRPPPTQRLYQEEIAEKAIEKNVIAYLGTGTGKTYIAMMVIKHKADAILAAGKMIVFFAPTVSLVSQQARALQTWLDLRVKMCVGETGVDLWRQTEWQQLRQETDVIVCTPMVMLNALHRSFVRMKDIGLLVVDECHNCRKNDPANRIMKDFYHRMPAEERPHVFGMTASPVNGGKRNCVLASFAELEANLDCQVITAKDHREELVAVAPVAQVMGVEYLRDVLTAVALRDRLDAACGLAKVAGSCLKQRQTLRDQQVLVAQLQEEVGRSVAGLLDDWELEALGSRGTVEQVAAWLEGVRQVAGDMGAWPAAVALAAVLGRPEEEAPDFAQWQAAWAGEQDDDDDMEEPPAEVANVADGGDAAAADACGVLQKRVAPLVEQLRESRQHLQLLLNRFTGVDIPPAGPGEPQPVLPTAGQPLARRPVDVRLSLEAQAVQAALRGTFNALAAVLVQSVDQRAELCAAFERAVRGSMQGAAEGVLRPCVEALLAAVPPQALSANVLHPSGAVSQAWEQAMGCPLVTNKPRAAVQYLLHDLAEHGTGTPATGTQPTGGGGANGDANGAAHPASQTEQHWSCIIFVQRKLTAVCLWRLLEAIPETAQKLPSAIITGSGGRVASMSLQRQVKVLEQFRRGRVVALVATSVAEEGLDLQSCQLVLRYHLPTNVLSYVQSRGRARKRQSRMAMLMRAGDAEEAALVEKIHKDEQRMQQVAQLRTQQLEAAEDAEDDESEDIDLDTFVLLAVGGEGVEYRVPSTGAMATLAGAKQLLHMYCQKLPSDKYTRLRPRFTRPRWTQDGAQLPLAVCCVLLPNAAPMHRVQGAPQRSFNLARASAALAAIRELHQAGALNDHLQPLVQELEDAHARCDEEREQCQEDQGQQVPVSVMQQVPHVLTWDGASRRGAAPAPTGPGQTYTLHTYGFSLQPPATPSSLKSGAGSTAASSNADMLPTAHGQQAVRMALADAPAGAGDAAGGPCLPAAGELDGWGEELWGAVEEWGLLLPRRLPDLPTFRVYVPRLDGQTARPLQVRVVYRGPVVVDGARLRCLQAAHSTTMRNVTIKPKHKHRMGSEAATSAGELPTEPIPPAAWAASSHGAWYILAPVKLPAQRHSADLSEAAPQNGCASGDALEVARKAQQAAQLDWPAVERLLRGVVALEDAFDFTGFADPSFRQLATDALLRMMAGCVVETRYNGCRYRVLGPAPEPTTLRSPFPPPTSDQQEAEEQYANYLDYYERRHLQAGLVPDQPLLLATRHVSLVGAAHILAPVARGTKRPAAAEAADKAGRPASTSKASVAADAAASCSRLCAAKADSMEDPGLAVAGSSRDPIVADCAAEKQLLMANLELAPDVNEPDVDEPEAGGEEASSETGPALAENGTAHATGGAKQKRWSQVSAEVLLPGQVCCLHPVGGWQWRALQLLPGLTYRLHSLLLMDQLRETLLAVPGLPRQHGLEELLAAFTTMATREDFNLERYELLGDAVLKLATCFALFRHHPGDHEGLLTVRKDALVSNRHLAIAAERAGLHRYLRIWQYDHSAWLLQQPGLSKLPPPTTGQVRRKTLADLVEALLGLTFHTQGMPGTVALLRHLDVLPPHLLAHLERISAKDTHLALQHLFTSPPVHPELAALQPSRTAAAADDAGSQHPQQAPSKGHTPFVTTPPDGATGLPARGHPMAAAEVSAVSAAAAADVKSHRLKAERLARASRAVGWVFGNPELVHEALTHCSWPHPSPPCYQRLEFLGDAVLDLLVTYQLFVIYPDLPPGQLHPRKAGIVNNHRLAMLAARAGLQKGLLHFNAALQADITRYLAKLDEQQQLKEAAAAPASDHQQPCGGLPVAAQPQEVAAVGGQVAEAAVAEPQAAAARKEHGQGGVAGVVVVEAPKVMADIVEALLGAVFLDCGGDLLAAAQVCTRLHLLAPGAAVHRLDPSAVAPAPVASSLFQ